MYPLCINLEYGMRLQLLKKIFITKVSHKHIAIISNLELMLQIINPFKAKRLNIC